MATPSKDIYDNLLNDERFWEKPDTERLEIIDFAANKFAAEDMPDEELMNWSSNRRRARMVSKLGVDGFNTLIQDIQATPEGGELPSTLNDPLILEELAPRLPLGRAIPLSATEESKNPDLESLSGGVDSPAVFEVNVPGSKGIELKFVPHPTKLLLDISTPEGSKRHKFESFEQVPKNGREMTQFLANEYGESFGIDGTVDGVLNQAGGAIKRFASEAVRTVANVPNMLEATITDIFMGDEGQKFAENNTLDADGNVVPMSEELKTQLRKEADWLRRSTSSGGSGDEYGFGGGPTMTIEEAFVRVHNEHLKKLGPIAVTGKLEPKGDDYDFTADDRFAPLERLKLAGNPNLPEGMSDRSKFLKEGSTVEGPELLAAHIALADAPKAKALSKIWEDHMSNIQAIDEVYGASTEQVLRSSRDGLVQSALNFQQDAIGMSGQMLPMIPLSMVSGGLFAAPAGASASTIAAYSAAGQAAVAPFMAATGYSGNMAESVGSIYQDQMQAGKGPREAILKAIDGGITAAAVALPLDLAGDMALGKLLGTFGKAYKELPPSSQEGLAKRIASMMDEAAGKGPGVARQIFEQGALQAVSEFSGEFTRAQVADIFRDNPDGAVANAKQALYEGLLAFAGITQTAALNSAASDITNLWSDWRTSKAMEAGGFNADVLRELNKLPVDERQERMREYMGAKEAREGEAIPPPSINGAAVVPVRQTTTAPEPTAQETISEAFASAPVTTDESELAALSAIDITPGDVMDYNGQAVRILGAPLSAEGTSVTLTGITQDGQEIQIPEAEAANLRLISSEEGQAAEAIEQSAITEEPPAVELPPVVEERTTPDPAPSPSLSFNGARLGRAELELTPSTVNFAASSVSPDVFDVAPDGTTSFNFGKLPNKGRPINIVLNPIESETGESSSAPAGPSRVARSYEVSAPVIEQWARGQGYWLRGTSTLADFAASEGFDLSAILPQSEWDALGEYSRELPVVVVDGQRDASNNSVKASNIRISRGASVADGIVVPREFWSGLHPLQKSYLITHEVLHSAIGDWSQAAQAENASSDMRSTFKEMGEIGDNLLKSVKSATTPEGMAFREHFSMVFDSPHYNPENPTELVEELLIRGLTDARSRRMMQSVTPDMKPIQPNEGNQKTETFWDKVVSLFRKALGFGKAEQQPLQSLFDRFYDLNTQIREQRSTITVTPRYASKEAAESKAAEMGLPKGSYTINNEKGSFHLTIGEMGSAGVREAQRELDRNIALNWTLEEGETASDQLQSRMKKIVAAQNKLAATQEAFFNSMANTTGLNIIMDQGQVQAISDATFLKQREAGETNVSNRFVLRVGLPATILETLTDAGAHQEAYARSVAQEAINQWEAGFRSFAAWKVAMEKRFPHANLTSLWEHLQESVAETLRNVGANGTTSIRYDRTQGGLARQEEYANFLKAPTMEKAQSFIGEAEAFSKTKLSTATRAALFNYGPLAPERNQFLSLERTASGALRLSFNEEAYKREYEAAAANSNSHYRLRDLDGIPEAVRQTKERIKGTKKAKARLRTLFIDILSRQGIDKESAGYIWRQVGYPTSVNSPELTGAIDGALDRADRQFGLSPRDKVRARKAIKDAAKEFKRAFRRVHRRSPEVILNPERTEEVLNAAKAKARMLGRTHGYNAAAVILRHGSDDLGLRDEVFEALTPAYKFIVEGAPIPVPGGDGFSAEIVEKLRGSSLDATYRTAFINGARSALLRQAVEDNNNEASAVSDLIPLWLGQTSTEASQLIGGQEFAGKNLFSGLIQPAFDAIKEYHRHSALIRDVASGGLSDATASTVTADADAALKSLEDTYSFMMKGETPDVEVLRQRLANEASFYSPEFEASFDADVLRFQFGMSDNLSASASKRAEDYSFTGTLTPGIASSLLKDIQDLRGAMKTNATESDFRAADFSSRSFSDPESNREERRNKAQAWNEKLNRKEDWNLKTLQTKALLALSEGEPSRAMALARLLLSESVDVRGHLSSARVSELIEEQLTERAAAETNAAFLRQRPLEQILPRIERAVPLSPQRVRLALADGGAELANISDVIESFALMDDSPMGSTLAGFLRGNTRPIPVLLVDTARMNEESRQAFRQSELLRGSASAKLQPNQDTDAIYGGELIVVDVAQAGSEAASRILAEAMRDMFAQPGTQGLQRKAEGVFQFLSTFSTNLDHGISELQHDIESGYVTDLGVRETANELARAGEKWGGYANMGAIPLAIEILSNGEFRRALSIAPPSYFPVSPDAKSPAGAIIMEQARVIAASDLNEAARRNMDAGLAYDTLAEEVSESDEFGNIGQAFEGLSFAEAPSPPNFAEQAIANAMELVFTASQMADFSGFADQSIKYTDTVLPGAREAGRVVLDATATEILKPDGGLNPDAAAELNKQAQAAAGVLRSLRKRFGANVDGWISEELEQSSIESTVEEMPGASAHDVATTYQLKAAALPDNVLFSGNKQSIQDNALRQEMAHEYARDFWRTVMGSAERQHILREISQNAYSMHWMRDMPIKWLEDLAEYSMRPNVTDGVRGQIWGAIGRGVSTDPGVKAGSMRDINWHLLYDKWREIKSADIAGNFLTDTKYNAATFYGNTLGSLENFAHNDAIYRIYGAASPALRDNIIGMMGVMEIGSTGTRGHTGFKSKMIGYEDRFRKLSSKLGAYKSGYVRATLAGYLTQYAENSTAQESVAKMAGELRKGLANLKVDGKNALGSYKLRHLYEKQMSRFLPLADSFAQGLIDQQEYETQLMALLTPDEIAWLQGVRDMFKEIQPAMEVASRLLGRKQGRFENYIPMMNGRVAHDSAEFLDNQFRAIGEKVGTSKPRSMNTRFDENPEDQRYLLDLDGSHIIGMLRRDVFMLETVSGGLLLHETIGTRNDRGGVYKGRIEKIAETKLSVEDMAKLNVTLSGLRGVYDRTRSGFQSGINIDNRTRRFLTTSSQVGAFYTLAAIEQLWKQTVPGFIVYMGRLVGNMGRGDFNQLRGFLSTTTSLAPGNKQLRANMRNLMKTYAPAVYLRGTDGNAAFKERLSLELKNRFGEAPLPGVALDHLSAFTVGAIRGSSRIGLEFTTGKADSLLTDRIFYTEYARRAMAAGLSYNEAFEPSNWNPVWAKAAKASTEELVGTSAVEERGRVMQFKGKGVASEFLATVVRAFGSHNISLAAHSRALANEFMRGDAKQRAIAGAKLAEVVMQQALFNAMAKPVRDLILAQIMTLIPGLGDDAEENYEWLLENIPWERKPQPITSGYDWLQTRGWRTLFDSAPVLGAAGAALSLPVVNDMVRELAESGLKPAAAELMDEDYTPFKKEMSDVFIQALGYTGGVIERLTDAAKVGTQGSITDFSDDKWIPAAISAVATRDVAGRIFQEYKGSSGGEGSSRGSSAFYQ